MNAVVNVLAVIDAAIAELRHDGNTGHVENLQDARAAIEHMQSALRRVARMNPDAGEIGAGMLQIIVSDARTTLAHAGGAA